MTSLEERTLVVRNLDGDKLTTDILEELFSNFGPVVKVVLRKNHAFIEYSQKQSVGYAWAMTEGLCLQGRSLRICPKLEDDPFYYSYRDSLSTFENRVLNDKSYVDSLLSPEQLKEKQDLVAALNSRDQSTLSKIENRLREYEKHFKPKSSYNIILDRDLFKECSRYHSPSSQHQYYQSHNHQSPSSHHQRSHSLDRVAQRDFDNNHHYNRNHNMHQNSNSHYHSQPDLRQSWHAGMDYGQPHHSQGPPFYPPGNQGQHQQPQQQPQQHPNWGNYDQHPYEPPHGRFQHHHQQYQSQQQYQPPPHQYGHFQDYYQDPRQQGPNYHHPHPNQFRPYPPPHHQRRH